MEWIFISHGYPDHMEILILSDAYESTEIPHYDLTGWFYNKEDVVYEHRWYHDENTDSDVEYDYFLENTGAIRELHSNDIQLDIWEWIFSQEIESWIKEG